MKKLVHFWSTRSIVAKIIICILVIMLSGVGIARNFMLNKLEGITVSNQQETYLEKIKTDSKALEDFINGAKIFLTAYTNSPDIVELSKHLDDPQVVARAQKFTEEYSKSRSDTEGIFYANNKAKTIVHTSAKAQGLVTRDEKTLPPLLASLEEAGDAICITGIKESPASGNLCLTMFKANRDKNKKIIGWGCFSIGIAQFTDEFKSSINDARRYQLMNINDGLVVLSDKQEELNNVYSDFDNLSEILKNDSTIVKEDNDSVIVTCKNIMDGKFALIEKISTKQAKESASQVCRQMLGILNITLIVCFVVLVALKPFFTKDSKKVQSVADEVGNLNLSSSNDDIIEYYYEYNNEAGNLAKVLKNLKHSLVTIISSIKKESDNITNISSNLTENSNKLLKISDQTRDVATALIASVEETNASIESVSEEISKSASSMSQIDERVYKSKETIQSVKKDAVEFGKKADKVSKENDVKVTSTGEEIDVVIKALAESKNINTIVSDIKEIASQTNLLSLNASIEAARAGEAGKGFAVVADEIRALSEQSSSAASKIEQMVEKCVIASEDAGKLFESVQLYIKEDISDIINTFCNETNKNLDAMSELEKMLEAVTDASDSLKKNIDSVVLSMKEIQESAEHNSDDVEKVSSSSSNTSDAVAQLSIVVEKCYETIGNLEKEINKFIL